MIETAKDWAYATLTVMDLVYWYITAGIVLDAWAGLKLYQFSHARKNGKLPPRFSFLAVVITLGIFWLAFTSVYQQTYAFADDFAPVALGSLFMPAVLLLAEAAIVIILKLYRKDVKAKILQDFATKA